jgi:cellulose synthase/poly-beta-1,6-N-acetylglucosamine synthase-like glycosyltransferase
VSATTNTTVLDARIPAASPRVAPASLDVGVVGPPRPHLYLAILIAWALTLLWFHPRLTGLLDMAESTWAWISVAYFIAFSELAWLYGLYNIGVVTFAAFYRRRPLTLPEPEAPVLDESLPPVAVLYTTYNDFVEDSARSCVELRYPRHHVYLLDDSTLPDSRQRVDEFASRYPGRVTVVRRPDRTGYKAGNLNHALSTAVREPFFVIADADEILPADFLRRLVPRMLADERCGFIQANHRANPSNRGSLARAMGRGIDIHWRWYQPLRNRYGFVMFLGHGALLRRECWERAGGFPELVSEDLAYALAIREWGYYGRFAEDVVCYEDFPHTVRAFRVRHVKWTRGTCEFLYRRLGTLLRSRRVSRTEKLDVLFPTLNLPLSMGYFLFMVNAGIVLPLIWGEPHPLTLVVAQHELTLPLVSLPAEFARIFTPGFYMITVLTILAPVLCFILDLWRKPVRLLRFLAHSTVLYAALSTISTLSVLSFALTRQARFLVTGDSADRQAASRSPTGEPLGRRIWELLADPHPDQAGIWLAEVAVGVVFLAVSLLTFQVALFGLAVAFLLLPALHFSGWIRGTTRVLVWVPFSLIVTGILLGGASLMGLQPVLFGYGFHF